MELDAQNIKFQLTIFLVNLENLAVLLKKRNDFFQNFYNEIVDWKSHFKCMIMFE